MAWHFADRRYELCRELGLELPEVGRRHRTWAKGFLNLSLLAFPGGFSCGLELPDWSGSGGGCVLRSS